ncbi:MAG: hypothetical protein AAGF55_05810 [Pseudomonadota bacterium]
MIQTFILGILAGWGAPMVEPQLRRPLQQAFSSELSPVELRAASLVICIFGTSLIALFIASASAVPLTLGAVVGVLAGRLMERFRAMRAPDYDS